MVHFVFVAFTLYEYYLYNEPNKCKRRRYNIIHLYDAYGIYQSSLICKAMSLQNIMLFFQSQTTKIVIIFNYKLRSFPWKGGVFQFGAHIPNSLWCKIQRLGSTFRLDIRNRQKPRESVASKCASQVVLTIVVLWESFWLLTNTNKILESPICTLDKKLVW